MKYEFEANENNDHHDYVILFLFFVVVIFMMVLLSSLRFIVGAKNTEKSMSKQALKSPQHLIIYSPFLFSCRITIETNKQKLR